jgi:hypothetical protein
MASPPKTPMKTVLTMLHECHHDVDTVILPTRGSDEMILRRVGFCGESASSSALPKEIAS